MVEQGGGHLGIAEHRRPFGEGEFVRGGALDRQAHAHAAGEGEELVGSQAFEEPSAGPFGCCRFFQVGLAPAPRVVGKINASPINALRWRAIGGADRDNSQSSAR